MAVRLSRGQEHVNKSGAFGRIVAEGEDFLELINDHEHIRLSTIRAGTGVKHLGVRACWELARGQDPDGGRAQCDVLGVP